MMSLVKIAENMWFGAEKRGFIFHLFSTKRPQDPLEANLDIFGRISLTFFCLKAPGKKWETTPLVCAWAVVVFLKTQKSRKRAPRPVELNFFINCDRQKRFSQNAEWKMNGRPTKRCLRNLIFAKGLVMISETLVMILSRFSTLKDHN